MALLPLLLLPCRWQPRSARIKVAGSRGAARTSHVSRKCGRLGDALCRRSQDGQADVGDDPISRHVRMQVTPLMKIAAASSDIVTVSDLLELSSALLGEAEALEIIVSCEIGADVQLSRDWPLAQARSKDAAPSRSSHKICNAEVRLGRPLTAVRGPLSPDAHSSARLHGLDPVDAT